MRFVSRSMLVLSAVATVAAVASLMATPGLQQLAEAQTRTSLASLQAEIDVLEDDVTALETALLALGETAATADNLEALETQVSGINEDLDDLTELLLLGDFPAIKVPDDGGACNADSAGQLRYNAEVGGVEVCNGSAWVEVDGGRNYFYERMPGTTNPGQPYVSGHPNGQPIPNRSVTFTTMHENSRIRVRWHANRVGILGGVPVVGIRVDGQIIGAAQMHVDNNDHPFAIDGVTSTLPAGPHVVDVTVRYNGSIAIWQDVFGDFLEIEEIR